LTPVVLGMFTDPLPSNRRPIFAPVGSQGNVFTESLPSNGSIRHNTFYHKIVLTFKTNVLPVIYRSKDIFILCGVMQRVLSYDMG
jgi:hypothetical protein